MGDPAAKILLVDPDPTSCKMIAAAFNGAGFALRFVRESKKTAGAIRLLQPDLLLANADLGTPLAKDAFDALASDVAFASIPVAFLTSQTADAAFTQSFKSGLVDLLAKPFSAATHLGQVRRLLGALKDRSGILKGQGDRKELSALVDHLRRAQRSGVLTVNARTPEEGKAFFANGVLKSAEHAGRTGPGALTAILALASASWVFSDVGASPGDAAAVVIEVGGDEPLLVEAADDEAGIDLDVEPVQSAEILLEEVVEEPEPAPVPAGPPVPLLLVDDDPELCRMFGIFFQKHGFTVDVAADGVAGFDQALSGRFAAIIADLNMPRMDGWGMLRMLREDFRTREIPVAFLSCHDDYRESLKALDAGAQAYFSKATKLDALSLQIRELLEPRKEFERLLESGKGFPISVAGLGPQWILRTVCARRLSGRLQVKDNWAHYRVDYKDGSLVDAQSISGGQRAGGDAALAAFIASRGAEGQVIPGAFPSPRSLPESPEEAISKAVAALNESERLVRESLLVGGKRISVNAALYALYAQVGPKAWLDAARLLCEEKLPPKEVLARLDTSPLEVEEAIRDLVRRGVVQLSAS